MVSYNNREVDFSWINISFLSHSLQDYSSLLFAWPLRPKRGSPQ